MNHALTGTPDQTEESDGGTTSGQGTDQDLDRVTGGVDGLTRTVSAERYVVGYRDARPFDAGKIFGCSR